MSHVRVWCEWDIGEEDSIYESKEAALAHLQDNENLKEIVEFDYADDSDVNTIEDLVEIGMLGFKPVTIYKKKS